MVTNPFRSKRSQLSIHSISLLNKIEDGGQHSDGLFFPICPLPYSRLETPSYVLMLPWFITYPILFGPGSLCLVIPSCVHGQLSSSELSASLTPSLAHIPSPPLPPLPPHPPPSPPRPTSLPSLFNGRFVPSSFSSALRAYNKTSNSPKQSCRLMHMH